MPAAISGQIQSCRLNNPTPADIRCFKWLPVAVLVTSLENRSSMVGGKEKSPQLEASAADF